MNQYIVHSLGDYCIDEERLKIIEHTAYLFKNFYRLLEPIKTQKIIDKVENNRLKICFAYQENTLFKNFSIGNDLLAYIKSVYIIIGGYRYDTLYDTYLWPWLTDYHQIKDNPKIGYQIIPFYFSKIGVPSLKNQSFELVIDFYANHPIKKKVELHFTSETFNINPDEEYGFPIILNQFTGEEPIYPNKFVRLNFNGPFLGLYIKTHYNIKKTLKLYLNEHCLILNKKSEKGLIHSFQFSQDIFQNEHLINFSKIENIRIKVNELIENFNTDEHKNGYISIFAYTYQYVRIKNGKMYSDCL